MTNVSIFDLIGTMTIRFELNGWFGHGKKVLNARVLKAIEQTSRHI